MTLMVNPILPSRQVDLPEHELTPVFLADGQPYRDISISRIGCQHVAMGGTDIRCRRDRECFFRCSFISEDKGGRKDEGRWSPTLALALGSGCKFLTRTSNRLSGIRWTYVQDLHQLPIQLSLRRKSHTSPPFVKVGQSLDVFNSAKRQPPLIRFETPCYHPNVAYPGGDICLDILKVGLS